MLLGDSDPLNYHSDGHRNVDGGDDANAGRAIMTHA